MTDMSTLIERLDSVDAAPGAAELRAHSYDLLCLDPTAPPVDADSARAAIDSNRTNIDVDGRHDAPDRPRCATTGTDADSAHIATNSSRATTETTGRDEAIDQSRLGGPIPTVDADSESASTELKASGRGRTANRRRRDTTTEVVAVGSDQSAGPDSSRTVTHVAEQGARLGEATTEADPGASRAVTPLAGQGRATDRPRLDTAATVADDDSDRRAGPGQLPLGTTAVTDAGCATTDLKVTGPSSALDRPRFDATATVVEVDPDRSAGPSQLPLGTTAVTDAGCATTDLKVTGRNSALDRPRFDATATVVEVDPDRHARDRSPLGTAAIAVDVGCGSGRAVAELAGRGVVAIGIDPSEQMIDAARTRWPALDFRLGTAEALPLPDESVSGYRADKVFHEIADPTAALAEARRVLVPGGRIVLLGQDWDALIIDSDDPETTRVMVHARADAITNPRSARAYRNLLLASGFHDVTVEARTPIFTDELMLPMLTGLAAAAAASNKLNQEVADGWVADQTARARSGRLLVAIPLFIAAATRR